MTAPSPTPALSSANDAARALAALIAPLKVTLQPISYGVKE